MKLREVPQPELELAAEIARAIQESLLPVSKATNAYELLEEVCQAITEEPLRYNQQTWIDQNIGLRREFEEEVPACGTMACIAGWVCTLRRTHANHIQDVPMIGARLLGFQWYVRDLSDFSSYEEYAEACVRDTQPVRDLFSDKLLEGSENLRGTPEYAAMGVEEIRKFMATHEARLKATTYEPR